MRTSPPDATARSPELRWRNSFAALDPSFYTRLDPTPLPQPYWVGRSSAVARSLGLSDTWMASDAALAVWTGNTLLPGAQPLASVYSGHQFGQWAGQLGDGRALLLGEIDVPGAETRELQLKGAGLTPYSRMGDGRAVLRSSIREFLCSQAMQGLGIATTLALCVTGSDAPVRRETVETASVVTRVAPSFLRFGHFEHFSYSGDHDRLRELADYTIDRFYPQCREGAPSEGQVYAALLQAVSERTAALIASWQGVGFCHGVMNTDNMSMLGLTIDYGPFQFLDAFNPGHVCNHSDTQGRYAYNRQPNIAYWNLFCLGQALLPLIGEQALAVQALESYKTVFPQELQLRFRAKLGLTGSAPEDLPLIEEILKLLASDQVDFTIFWRRLSEGVAETAAEPVRDLFLDRDGFDQWQARHEKRLQQQDRAAAAQTMLHTNPRFVLRNHLGEQAIRSA
ncbi:MAG: protein adenylyltransferase SelO, partial [Betaproteobacteria bacterium]